MSRLHLSDEILMAFADGELDKPVATAVEQAMASDPTIAKRVAGFLRSRRLVRSTFLIEAAPDVPPELRIALQAQIDRFEGLAHQEAAPAGRAPESTPPKERWRPFRIALAASAAAVAIAAASYLAGRQGYPAPQAAGPITHLGDPQVSHALSESPSGEEKSLPIGRMRVVSTFRMANGLLCREFRLQAPSGTTDAVACRNGGWTITFALASEATTNTYIPSGGADLIATYLRDAGAGEPLLDAAEIKALSEAGCLR